MKPLIIGEAPSKNETTPRPIEGRIGRKLAKFSSLTFEEFLETFDRVNLLEVRQDTKEKGFQFNAAEAAVNAMRMINNMFDDGRVVLLLGKRVAHAFGAHADYFQVQHLGTKAHVYVVPHPSGVNHYWNHSDNCEKVRQFFARILHEIK